MEGTLTDSTERADKTFAFKGPDDYAQVLVKGGVETCSLANNHSRDYGEQSYTDTISALEAAGLGTFGYDRIDYYRVELGPWSRLIGTYELAEGIGIKHELEQNIKTAKEQGAALTIVYFHLGQRNEAVPDETQVQLGHAAVDAGADLVIGSHPHVIQGYESTRGRCKSRSGQFLLQARAGPLDTDCMIFQQTFTVTGSDVASFDAIRGHPPSPRVQAGTTISPLRRREAKKRGSRARSRKATNRSPSFPRT